MAEKHPLEQDWDMHYECYALRMKRNKESEESSSSSSSTTTTATDSTTTTTTNTSPNNNNNSNPTGWNLKYLTTFSTVEDFWCLVSKLPKPDKLCAGSSYYLFHKGIYPAWEHPANKEGGELSITFGHGTSETSASGEPLTLSTLWMRTILACIGEQFGEHNSQICGAEVSVRFKFDRVALWIRSNEQKVALEIAACLRKLTGLRESVAICFRHHSDAIACGTTHTKIDYFHKKKVEQQQELPKKEKESDEEIKGTQNAPATPTPTPTTSTTQQTLQSDEVEK